MAAPPRLRRTSHRKLVGQPVPVRLDRQRQRVRLRIAAETARESFEKIGTHSSGPRSCADRIVRPAGAHPRSRRRPRPRTPCFRSLPRATALVCRCRTRDLLTAQPPPDLPVPVHAVRSVRGGARIVDRHPHRPDLLNRGRSLTVAARRNREPRTICAPTGTAKAIVNVRRTMEHSDAYGQWCRCCTHSNRSGSSRLIRFHMGWN
jgi:hypothetical protein